MSICVNVTIKQWTPNSDKQRA